MKIFTCNNCHERKEEIEFDYIYFRHTYSKICKCCEEEKNSENKIKIKKDKSK